MSVTAGPSSKRFEKLKLCLVGYVQANIKQGTHIPISPVSTYCSVRDSQRLHVSLQVVIINMFPGLICEI